MHGSLVHGGQAGHDTGGKVVVAIVVSVPIVVVTVVTVAGVVIVVVLVRGGIVFVEVMAAVVVSVVPTGVISSSGVVLTVLVVKVVVDVVVVIWGSHSVLSIFLMIFAKEVQKFEESLAKGSMKSGVCPRKPFTHSHERRTSPLFQSPSKINWAR